MKLYKLLIIAISSLMFSCFDKDENITNEYICNIETYDLKASKMEQIGPLLEDIAKQPEMANQLVATAEKLYSNYTQLLPISDTAIFLRGKARGTAVGSLFLSVARQPECFGKLDSVATKFLGIYNKSYISDRLLEVSKTYAMTGLLEGLARQPEADSLFNILSKKYLNLEIPTK